MSPKSHFSISERKLFLRIFDVVFAITSTILLTSVFSFYDFTLTSKNSTLWLFTLGVYILFFGQIFEMYDLKVASDKYLILRSTFLTVLFTTIAYVFTPIIAPGLPDQRIHILYFFLMLFGIILIWRFLYLTIIFSPRFFKYLLIIGENEEVEKIIDLIESKAIDHRIVAYISPTQIIKYDTIKWLGYLPETIKEFLLKDTSVNEILVTTFKEKHIADSINKELIYLFENGIQIRSINNYKEELTQRIPKSQLNNTFYDHFNFSKNHESNFYLTFVRIFDILLGLFGFVIFLLAIPFVFLLNLIGNQGPLFYHQMRVGKQGKTFKILKFRTMVTNAEKEGAVWASKNDSRITPFGKFLRKTRVDEIPQFINVLKGDMSMIGPRPERPEFVTDLEKRFPFYAIRHVIKPGLTGWAQVMYPYANDYESQHIKLCYDLYYIKKRSPFLDLKIFIKTISTVLFFKGS